MSLKLFVQSDSTEAYKILAVAKLAGVELELPSFQEAEAQSKSASGKLPVLETSEGPIFEANAIARYVASAGAQRERLVGSSAFEAAQIEQWVEFAANEIELPASVWTFPHLGRISHNAPAVAKAKHDLRRVFDLLNRHLASRTYLATQRVTLADVAVAAALLHAHRLVLDAAFRKPFGNVARWFTTVVNQPAVHAAFGAVQAVEKEPKAPEAAPEQQQQQAAKPAKEAAKPAKADEAKPAKAEEKPKKKKKDDDDEEDEENFEDDAPKGKNPLDQLPPSKLVMDEWKRTYSNNDTLTVAMPWLWEHFDEAGYSLWLCRYKFAHELTKVFMTANLVGGFLQRLDKLRKYGFGCMLIFGEDNEPQSIEGAWLVRGTQMPAELTECDDFELYDWKQAHPGDAAEKQLVTDIFAWEGAFQGREQVWGEPPKAQKFNQGKTFK